MDAKTRTRITQLLAEPWNPLNQKLQTLFDDSIANKAILPFIGDMNKLQEYSGKLSALWRPDSDNVLGNTVNRPEVVHYRLLHGTPVEDCDGIARCLCAVMSKSFLLKHRNRLHIGVAFWHNGVKVCGHAYAEWCGDDRLIYNIGNWSRGKIRGPYDDTKHSALGFSGKNELLGFGQYDWHSLKAITFSVL